MIELAKSDQQSYIKLADVATPQGLSLKYLEGIAIILRGAGYINARRGKLGGYHLTRPADEYTVGMILRLLDDYIAPSSCAECESNVCVGEQNCNIRILREKLDESVDEVLENITLADLLEIEMTQV